MHKTLTQIFVFNLYICIYIINIKYIYENLSSNTYRNITLHYALRTFMYIEEYLKLLIYLE